MKIENHSPAVTTVSSPTAGLSRRDLLAGAGALAAAEWLLAEPRSPGLHGFDPVVDALVAGGSASIPGATASVLVEVRR